MEQQKVDTGALVKAIQQNPTKQEEVLLENPGVARMPASVYPDMARVPESNLVVARNTLPEVPFQLLIGLNNGTLEARPGLNSAFEFRLTLKDVKPGQTQAKLDALVEEMNARFEKMPNYPSCGFKVYLSQNGDLPNYGKVGNVVFTCSSLIHDSTNRHRNQTTRLDGEERISQEALLASLGLVQVPNDVVRAVAGMYRVAQGFPDTEGDIRTERDKGDVFYGKVARTQQGPSSGSAASYLDGVYDFNWNDYGHADADVGVVGGLSPELK